MQLSTCGPAVHSPGLDTFRDPAHIIQEPLKAELKTSRIVGERGQEIKVKGQGSEAGRRKHKSRGRY